MKYIVFKKGNNYYSIPAKNKNIPKVAYLLNRGIINKNIPKVKKITRITIEKKQPIKLKRIVKRKHLNRVMPFGMQLFKLKRLALKYGVEPDIIDFEHKIDRTLTYPENRNILEREIKTISNDVSLKFDDFVDNTDNEFRNFVDDLAWKFEAGDENVFETLESFGLKRENIKNKKDIYKFFSV